MKKITNYYVLLLYLVMISCSSKKETLFHKYEKCVNKEYINFKKDDKIKDIFNFFSLYQNELIGNKLLFGESKYDYIILLNSLKNNCDTDKIIKLKSIHTIFKKNAKKYGIDNTNIFAFYIFEKCPSKLLKNKTDLDLSIDELNYFKFIFDNFQSNFNDINILIKFLKKISASKFNSYNYRNLINITIYLYVEVSLLSAPASL